MARATWFCIDIECSGPVPHLYDMLSLGAVRVTAGPGGTFDVGDPFYVEIRPESGHQDPGAMRVHGLDPERLKREGLPLADALRALTAWVEAQTLPGSEPVFVGHNAAFDWSFVAYAFRATGLPNPFGYKALDTKSLAMGILGCHWLDSHKERLEVELALPSHDRSRAHRADYDAWYQGVILARLLERRPSCADS